MSQQTIREILNTHYLGTAAGDKEIMKDSITAILKLIREMVPGEQEYAVSYSEGSHNRGWNTCRKEILDRLEEMEACRK